MKRNIKFNMTCKDCIHFQPTQLIQYDITDINFKHPEPLWDCPYANDWCEENDEINTLCDNKFEPINLTNK